MAGNNRLTWQNVSAPDFSPSSRLLSDALGMFERTGDHLTSAINKFDAPGKRQAELAFAQNLAQHQDADSIRAAAASGALMKGVADYRQNAAMFDKANAAAKEMEAINYQRAQAKGINAQTDVLSLSHNNNVQEQEWAKANPGVVTQALNQLVNGDASGMQSLLGRQDLPYNVDKILRNVYANPAQLNNIRVYQENVLNAQRSDKVSGVMGVLNAQANSPEGLTSQWVFDYLRSTPDAQAVLSDPKARDMLAPILKARGIDINTLTSPEMSRAIQEAQGRTDYFSGSNGSVFSRERSNYSQANSNFTNLIGKAAWTKKVGDAPGVGSLAKPDGSYLTLGEFLTSTKNTREVKNEDGQIVRSGATGFSQNVGKYAEAYIKDFYGIPRDNPIPEALLKEEAGPELQMGLFQLQFEELLKRNVPGSMVSQGWSGLKKIAGSENPSSWGDVDPLLASLIVGAPENGEVYNPLNPSKKLIVGKGGDISSMQDVYALQEKLQDSGILDSWRDTTGGSAAYSDPEEADIEIEALTDAARQASTKEVATPTSAYYEAPSEQVSNELRKQIAFLQDQIKQGSTGINLATWKNTEVGRNPLAIFGGRKEIPLEQVQQQASDIDKDTEPYRKAVSGSKQLLSNIPELQNRVSDLLKAASLEQEIRSNKGLSKSVVDAKVAEISELRKGAKKQENEWFIDPSYSGSDAAKKVDAALTSKEDTVNSANSAYIQNFNSKFASEPDPQVFTTNTGAVNQLSKLAQNATEMLKAEEATSAINDGFEDSTQATRFVKLALDAITGKSQDKSATGSALKDEKSAKEMAAINEVKAELGRKIGRSFANLRPDLQEIVVQESMKESSIFNFGDAGAKGIDIDIGRARMMTELISDPNRLMSYAQVLQTRELNRSNRKSTVEGITKNLTNVATQFQNSPNTMQGYNPTAAMNIYSQYSKMLYDVFKPTVDSRIR